MHKPFTHKISGWARMRQDKDYMRIFYRRNFPAGGLSFLGEGDIINSAMESEPLSAPTELTYP